MNILRVISSMNPTTGGPCQGIRNSIPALERAGIRNEVVCLDAPDAAFLGADPFVIHALGESRGPWKYNKLLAPWLMANYGRFDAVIIHGLWLYPGHAVHKTMKKYMGQNGNVPKVYVMPHGMLDPWFQQNRGRKLKALRNRIYWKLIESKVVNSADALFFTCEEELRLARVPFRPYRPNRELNVGYGIPSPPSYTSKMTNAFGAICPEIAGADYLLFLSRIDIKKGIDLLITAYLDLKQEGYLLPRLVVAGPGKESPYGLKMQVLAASDRDILFPGMLTGEAKWGALYGCEAFVLPSHQENFGIAVVEAMACGKPVLISNQVNIWREITEGGGGIVGPDTIDGVRHQLLQWTQLSINKKEAMEKKAQGVYRSHFTITEAAKKLAIALNSYAQTVTTTSEVH